MKTNSILAAMLIGVVCQFAPAAAHAGDANRESIGNKLNHIRLDSFGPVNGMPLSVVIQLLDNETKKRDPEKKGINFLLNPNSVVIQDGSNTEAVDPETIGIRVHSTVRDITLSDALKIVVMTADHPIKYTVESYGVVFSIAAPEPASTSIAPVVVKTVPQAGAKEVAPGVAEIKVTFSKEMIDQCWNSSAGWEGSTPEFIEQPHFLADSRTCVMKVRLEAGKTYGWWLNSDKFNHFADKDNVPALPYLLTFQTKPD